MDNDQLADLKQFIAAAVSQATADLPRRDEMNGAISSAISGLRGEMHNGFSAIRDEMHSGLSGLRGEMHNGGR